MCNPFSPFWTQISTGKVGRYIFKASRARNLNQLFINVILVTKITWKY